MAIDIADVGVLELLTEDSRPTFILETHTHGLAAYKHPQIVFRNKALVGFLGAGGSGSFETWVATLGIHGIEGIQASTFRGRAWTFTTLRHRWLVVYCSQQQEESAELVDLPSPPASEGPDPSRANSICDHPPSVRQCLSSGATRPFDWIRSPDSELSPHQCLLKNHDWAATSLGPISRWSTSLKQAVFITGANPNPKVILWGEELIMIYNEAAAHVFGAKHPAALGARAGEIWSEVWDDLSEVVRLAVEEGKTTRLPASLLFLERYGYVEESYWSIMVLPFVDPQGYVVGAIDEFFELTASVLFKRRRDTLEKLPDLLSNTLSLEQLWTQFLSGLEECREDVPFAVLYALDDDTPSSSGPASPLNDPAKLYTLRGTLGIMQQNSSLPDAFDLSGFLLDGSGLARACRNASYQVVQLTSEEGTLPSGLTGPVHDRGFGDSIKAAYVLPVSMIGSNPLGFLILGTNPRRPLDEASLTFAQSLSDILSRIAFRKHQQRLKELQARLSAQLRETEREAERVEKRFTHMAENAPVGICSFKPDGVPVYVNDEYLRLLSISREEWMQSTYTGNIWRDTVCFEDIKDVEEKWVAMVTGQIPTFTFEVRSKRLRVDPGTGCGTPEHATLWGTSSVELDEAGNVLYIHNWLLDISHRKRVEVLQAQRLEEALEMKRQSSNFQDLICHELRNPLSAILQSADWIVSEAKNPASPEVVESIIDSAQTIILCAQHQKHIVDDVLTLSKLDSNLLVLAPDKIQPPQLIRKALRMFVPELQRAGVEATLEIEPSYYQCLLARDYVMLDQSRLLQVVINLLTNAIKFTQYSTERKITVSLAASYKRPDHTSQDVAFIEQRPTRPGTPNRSSEWGSGHDIFVQFMVRDTGRGLSKEETAQLFQRFSQASPKTYKQYGGSGLGLFISRELTELQDGQIGVSSKGLGEGSTFAFYVRARQCVSPQPSAPALHRAHTPSMAVSPVAYTPDGSSLPSPATPPVLPPRADSATTQDLPKADLSKAESSPLHVLLVEDNLINQRVVSKQLQAQGWTVHVANHGLEALEFIRRSNFWNASEERTADVVHIDVVLMDLEMPTMDGLTCVGEIRKLQRDGQLRSHVPIIAVTANARSEHINTAIAAGMDEVVTKPFRIPELVPQMQGVVARARRRKSSVVLPAVAAALTDAVARLSMAKIQGT